MKTGLERIAAKSLADKHCQFTSLTHHLTPELLWEQLKNQRNSRAAGIDGQSVREAKESFSTWSKEMLTAIHQKGYKPPDIRRVYIPKPGKMEKRPLGIPTVADSALQSAVSEVLTKIYEQDFTNSSFVGRVGRSAHNAVASLIQTIHIRKTNYVYEADLKNFFGSLDHRWMQKFIRHRVGDPRILSLINRWLKAGVVEAGKSVVLEGGTPQGGPISVLLSNIYLHYVLDLWIEKVVKPRMKGEITYLRYLDDFIVCFQYKSDALRFEHALKNRLSKFSLKLEPTKTQLVEFGRFAKENAHKRGDKVGTIYFLGFTFYCTRNAKGKFKVGLFTEKTRRHRSFQKIKELTKKIRHWPLIAQIRRINLLLGGLYRYYGIADNFKFLSHLYECVKNYWPKSLSKRSQKGKLTWKRYLKILTHFQLLRPKLYFKYADLDKLTLL